MVSGRYFLPKAPLLCLKWIPAWAVMSVNSMAAEGAGVAGEADAGTGDGVDDDGGEVAAVAECAGSTGETASGADADFCLQPTNAMRVARNREVVTRLRGVR